VRLPTRLPNQKQLLCAVQAHCEPANSPYPGWNLGLKPVSIPAETDRHPRYTRPPNHQGYPMLQARVVMSDSDSDSDEEQKQKHLEDLRKGKEAREKVDQCQDERTKSREELKDVWKEMRKISDDKKLTHHGAMEALHTLMLKTTSVRAPSPHSSLCFRQPWIRGGNCSSPVGVSELPFDSWQPTAGIIAAATPPRLSLRDGEAFDTTIAGARANHPRAAVHQAAGGAVESLLGGQESAGAAGNVAIGLPRRRQSGRRCGSHQQHGTIQCRERERVDLWWTHTGGGTGTMAFACEIRRTIWRLMR
jgi:hypothetical protein